VPRSHLPGCEPTTDHIGPTDEIQHAARNPGPSAVRPSVTGAQAFVSHARTVTTESSTLDSKAGHQQIRVAGHCVRYQSNVEDDGRPGLCDALCSEWLPDEKEWLCDWRRGGAPGRSGDRTGSRVRCRPCPARQARRIRPVLDAAGWPVRWARTGCLRPVRRWFSQVSMRPAG
jgi:hypothetical protein